jgi:DNA-binding NarL/FixJ family response regulator
MSTQQKRKISLLIADDHPLALEGIRSILDKVPDMEIVGQAEDGNQIKRLVAELQPDILLLDLKMPNLSPAEFEEWVRENYPNTVTLILTSHDRDAYLSNMLAAGAAGYLNKKLQAGQLVSSIRRAVQGEILFDDQQTERIVRWRADVKKKWESLSARESEVLQMLTDGADNKTISESLNIGIGTVEKHLTNIYKKLGLASRAEAILWWLEKGRDFRN